MKDQLLTDIIEKYESLNENPTTYLNGLLQSKPINYWEYVNLDTLLTLQVQRTSFKDEAIFIMYHQVTELFLKMLLHELKQVIEKEVLEEEFLKGKLNRICRYTEMLINSFDIMKGGMDYNDYNTFRVALAPASGFQSAQFRIIELYCTRLQNLVNKKGQERLNANPTTADYFEHIYWKDAGLNRKTGKKTLTLLQFEERYQNELMGLANTVKGNTLEEKILKLNNPSAELIKQLKHFDELYNLKWPAVHLETAQHYLDSKGENKQATGGSEWKKYLHPAHQQRKFFPSLWSKEAIDNWGK